MIFIFNVSFSYGPFLTNCPSVLLYYMTNRLSDEIMINFTVYVIIFYHACLFSRSPADRFNMRNRPNVMNGVSILYCACWIKSHKFPCDAFIIFFFYVWFNNINNEIPNKRLSGRNKLSQIFLFEAELKLNI